MSVNGQEASADEFSMYLDFKKALVANYFKQTYGANYTEHFWTTEYSDGTPLQKLMEEAKAQMTRTKIEQQLAQRSGVIKDIGYQSFLNEMEMENSRRSKAAANNEIVYGPISFEVQAYYSYYMSGLENATIDALRNNGIISISEEQLKRDYEINKKSKYAQQGAIDLEWATLPYGSGTAYKDKSDALVKMKQLEKAFANGASFKETAKGLGVDVIDSRITNASRRAAALEIPLALQKAEHLEVGKSSDIFDENEALHIIRCVSIGDMIIQPFDQVKDSIASQLALEKYRDIVERDVKEAAIKWNRQSGTNLMNKWIGMNSD
ncbi:hypothetical protein Back11_36560 [Paenibacillus baekrokdamisoli]|uniref:PpiC domain-containing protein n=2 Tax=Paenibacillus baekrokdamisoli TaxID=1712516 RepID=A0A3G9J907_9BACL|nr:hypothetical protein Back11_36560 [Paenibacillus baekrokdamisoli]